MLVRRKLFWVERFGFIEEGIGLVYSKGKNYAKEPKTITLAGKVLKKGKRKSGADFLAVWSATKLNEIEVKICFDTPKELEQWSKAVAYEMRRGDISSLPIQSSTIPVSPTLAAQPQYTEIKAVPSNNPRGNIPENDVSQKVGSSKAGGIPGYVSKFNPYLDAEEKSLLESAEDTYSNRTDWNLTFSSESSLFYSSKTKRQLTEDHKKNLGVEEQGEEEDKEHPLLGLLFPGALAALAGAYFLSFILPGFLNVILALIAAGGAGFHLFREKKRLDEENEDSGNKVAFKPYKIKLVTYVVGLPDDIAKAVTSEDCRKNWDLVSNLLNEKSEMTHLYKKNAQTFYILDKRVTRSKNAREILVELSKIKGKPYFLKMVVYSSVSAEMNEKVGEEAIKNSFNSLRNFVATEDSISELNVSFSNLKGEGSNLSGTPTLTITDMIGEIEEIDMGDDGFTEMDEEEGKERISIVEEVKVTGAQPTGLAPSPSKELTFEEKFEIDVLKAPAHEQDIIRKAKESVDILLNLADNPGWKQIKKKPNDVFTMDAEGGLKWIKGEGVINYTPEEIAEYLARENVQKQFDDQFVEGGTVEEYAWDASVSFNRFKGVLFVSGRDFCMLAITVRFPDGRVVISSRSTVHEDCPSHKKYVRAELIIGGWVLIPNKDEPGTTFAQYISQSDLKGNIPKKVVNSVSEKQGVNVSKIEGAMKKNF